jgi:hypothetical protein
MRSNAIAELVAGARAQVSNPIKGRSSPVIQ